MFPVPTVLILWLLFGGTHLILSAPPAREVLVRRLGEDRFVLIYSIFAAVSFTALVLAFGIYRGEGAPALGWGHSPLTRDILTLAAFAGAMLLVAGILGYFRSPMAIFRTELRPPRGIERITHHPYIRGNRAVLTFFLLPC